MNRTLFAALAQVTGLGYTPVRWVIPRLLANRLSDEGSLPRPSRSLTECVLIGIPATITDTSAGFGLVCSTSHA